MTQSILTAPANDPPPAPALLQGESVADASQLAALLHGVGVAPLLDTGWIRVTGSDRVRWLNGMVTNSIQDLAQGAGCYSFVMNAQGRIQGDLTAFLLDDCLAIETSRDQVGALIALLDRFIIMDDVELTDITDDRVGILLAGPQALRTVQQLGGGTPCSSSQPASQSSIGMSLKQTVYDGSPVWLIQAYSPLVPRFEIWADRATMTRISAELTSVPQLSPEALEQLRLLEGTPRYGVDIRNSETAKDLPQETAQTRALHFSKGCYLGQEIVERIRSRGSVHRTLTGFILSGALPQPGTILEAEAKPVGEITSAAAVPMPDGTTIRLALGYIRREALQGSPVIAYPGGTATPTSLPWSPT